jgi:hypothetical protein
MNPLFKRTKHAFSSCETNTKGMQMNRLCWYGHQQAIMNLLACIGAGCQPPLFRPCSGRSAIKFQMSVCRLHLGQQFSTPWTPILFELTSAPLRQPLQTISCGRKQFPVPVTGGFVPCSLINKLALAGFHGGDCEECRLLGCYAVRLL